jgi:hypothetical protein
MMLTAVKTRKKGSDINAFGRLAVRGFSAGRTDVLDPVDGRKYPKNCERDQSSSLAGSELNGA